MGVSGDFETNPLLRQFNTNSEEHIAALVDFPVKYDGDAFEFSVRPYGRLSNSQGYSSLASNYAHLDSAAQFTNELGSTTVQTSLARDSSLYYAGALVYGVGVARDSESVAGDWTRLFTERSQLALDVNWLKVRYDLPTNENNIYYSLVDYRYLSAGPTYSYSLSERDTLKILANVGDYQSLNGATQSKSDSLQVGFSRLLTEIWALTINAGYSNSSNTEKFVNPLLYYYYGVVEYETQSSKQNGTVYSATLSRQGERFNLNASASRALQPTGFGFLSRQDSFNLYATYKPSERWDFALGGTWQRAVQPQESAGVAQLNAGEVAILYESAHVAANWHWTPQWVVTLQTTRIVQGYGPPTIGVASTGVNVDITYHFLRNEL